jgi:hypothetical protein
VSGVGVTLTMSPIARLAIAVTSSKFATKIDFSVPWVDRSHRKKPLIGVPDAAVAAGKVTWPAVDCRPPAAAPDPAPAAPQLAPAIAWRA